MLVISILVIAVVSFFAALFSLRKELRKSEEKKAKEVTQSLSKGRVLFYSPSSSSES